MTAKVQVADYSAALVQGPWTHRWVSARGLRFHVATMGPDDGPLVLLLHGVPQFWWATRHQLVALGKAGYHAAAVDLRGFGASDKPPNGYTLPTLANDVAGVITALGHERAVVVGHGVGGMVAWTMVSQCPLVLNGIGPVSAIHPATRTPWRRLVSSPRAALHGMMLRRPPNLVRRNKHGAVVEPVASGWAAETDWMAPEAIELYVDVLRIPNAAEKASELVRWAVRPGYSAKRRRFVSGARVAAHIPVLHLQGNQDRLLRPAAVHEPELGGARYRFVTMDQVGHFPLEQVPDRVNRLLLDWLGALKLEWGSKQKTPAQ